MSKRMIYHCARARFTVGIELVPTPDGSGMRVMATYALCKKSPDKHTGRRDQFTRKLGVALVESRLDTARDMNKNGNYMALPGLYTGDDPFMDVFPGVREAMRKVKRGSEARIQRALMQSARAWAPEAVERLENESAHLVLSKKERARRRAREEQGCEWDVVAGRLIADPR